MNRKAARLVVRSGALLLSLLVSALSRAQTAGGELSGVITDSSGAAVADARISVRSAATGQITEARTDSAGRYDVRDLKPGDYEVTVASDAFRNAKAAVTITPEGRQTLNLTLQSVISLEDLGFSQAQTRGSAQDQATLDKRSHMLKLHQRFGLITVVPLVATVIAGGSAGGKNSSSSGRNLHAALGIASVGLYSTSAYYALAAPKIEGTPTHGNIRLHKALAWVHGAGMILTPILGGIAYSQKQNGESVHGIASAHSAVAIVTVVAYGLAILTESLK